MYSNNSIKAAVFQPAKIRGYIYWRRRQEKICAVAAVYTDYRLRFFYDPHEGCVSLDQRVEEVHQ